MTRPSPFGTRELQHGVSLIGLMVGLVIASIALAGMLISYKATSTTTAQAALAARNAGEWTSGLLSAELDLQGAGYGLTTPTLPQHLAFLTNATLTPSSDGTTGTLSGTAVSVPLTGTAGGNALLWVDKPAATSFCHGLILPQDGSGALYELTLPSCSSVSPAPSSGWTLRKLAQPTVSRNASADSSPIMAVSTSLSIERKICTPFGIGTLPSSKSVLVTLQRTVGMADTQKDCSGNSCQRINVDAICLVNFAVS